jgi:hypothetical protein
MFVVYESEFQIVSDSPEAYEGQKELDFLRVVPASWDETRVLNGVPPKYVTIARRHGNDWYLGSLTDGDARELDVPLTFLGSGAYDAEIYADGPNAATQPKDSVVEKRRVDARTVLKLKLAPGGGSAIRLVPARCCVRHSGAPIVGLGPWVAPGWSDRRRDVEVRMGSSCNFPAWFWCVRSFPIAASRMWPPRCRSSWPAPVLPDA